MLLDFDFHINAITARSLHGTVGKARHCFSSALTACGDPGRPLLHAPWQQESAVPGGGMLGDSSRDARYVGPLHSSSREQNRNPDSGSSDGDSSDFRRSRARPIADWISSRRMIAARLISGRLLFGRHGGGGGFSLTAHTAQIGPVDIRPQFFARYSAAGGALDGRAALRWNRASSIDPLIHRWRLHAEDARQSGLSADFLARSYKWFLGHGSTIRPRLIVCQ